MASQINASNSGFGGIVSTGDSSGVLELQTTGTTALTIDTSQRVGFVAGTAAAPAITRTGDTNTGMFFPAADTIAFTEGGAEVMRIDASGNVGIGTSSPAYRIDAFTNATSTTVGANTVAAFYSNGNGYDSNIRFGDNVNSNIRLGYISGSMYMYTNGAERMRIDTSGNLLVGTTSASNLTAGGQAIRGSYTDTSLVYKFLIQNTNTATGTHLAAMFVGPNSSDTTSSYFDFYDAGGNTSQGKIGRNGSNAVAYTTTSDYRLKENIAPMTGALDKVAQLNPVTYTWKVDGSDGQGFIAHELQAVVPDCVTGEKDAVETYTDEEGNEQTRIKPQGVDTSFLVATLTAAIQEQQTIINDLKARIETLEAK